MARMSFAEATEGLPAALVEEIREALNTGYFFAPADCYKQGTLAWCVARVREAMDAAQERQ